MAIEDDGRLLVEVEELLLARGVEHASVIDLRDLPFGLGANVEELEGLLVTDPGVELRDRETLHARRLVRVLDLERPAVGRLDPLNVDAVGALRARLVEEDLQPVRFDLDVTRLLRTEVEVVLELGVD